MKTVKTLILASLFALYGCSDQQNTNTNEIPNLENKWTLIKTTGTIAGITHEFSTGTIIWVFKPNNTVQITNNNTNPNLQSGFPSGVYSYHVSENPAVASCPENITIQTSEYGCLSMYDNKMYIIETFADGITYHFELLTPTTTN